MPTPLLPSQYATEPFIDASRLRSDGASLRELADANGYLFFRGRIPERLLAPVRDFVRAFAAREGWILAEEGNAGVITARPGARLAGRGWDDPRWVDLQRTAGELPAFRELIESPLLLDILHQVYGEPAAPATANHVWLKLPGSPEHTTRPHRDTFYLPACPRLWTAWLPLTDTPLEVGPLGLVPGSHRTDAWPQTDALAGIDVPEAVRWATQPVQAGDVVFFGARTIHCAWSNVSPTAVRLSLDVRYEPLSTTDSLLRPGSVTPPPTPPTSPSATKRRRPL